MALGPCNNPVDSQGRELVDHGTTAFPLACYYDDLDKDTVPWHWHEELEAAVILEGSSIVAVGNEKYTLYPGDGFFANSGILHSCWNAGTPTCRFHSLVFHPRLVGGSLDSVFYQSYVRPLAENRSLESLLLKPEIPWQAQALESIERAWQACFQEPPGYEFTARSALSELVFLLHSHAPAPPANPGARSLRNGERIKRMLQFIHEHFADPLTTQAIAQSAAISESECLRCFRSTIGTTPIQYVKQYRIQQAALLLASTPDKISDIAGQCGFQDMSYFTRTFRECKGCLPSEYRRPEKPRERT